ncbi:hypothetical protein [Parasutterella excrementihominis]|uniref:hypothetical protein n=1 Tax=Parasutterella excrementihominis TaxID=487175 RepID=UPI003A903262
MVLKIIGALLVVVSAYFYGFHQGQNKEELKNARTQISALERTIEEFKAKQTSDAVALSELRIAESASRDELDRMRSQLADIERILRECPKPTPIGSVIDVSAWQSATKKLSTELTELLNSVQKTTVKTTKNLIQHCGV